MPEGAPETGASVGILIDLPSRESQQRLLADADAQLPGDAVRSLAPRAYHAGVDAVQMVRGADGDAIRPRVVSAARTEEYVVVVKVPSGRACGYGASPPVAREHRIAMARLPLPFRDDVLEETLEPAP